jgi:hypothetical protein
MASVSRAGGGQLPSLVAAAAADGKTDGNTEKKAEVRMRRAAKPRPRRARGAAWGVFHDGTGG